MSSTDPYPEVSGDESGIVPPQSARTSEWPKKLRTLTAAELDRLTIDNSGRFYWDGNLVNYDTQPKQLTDQTSDSLDHSMDILDRASFELAGRKAPATIEGELAHMSDALNRRDETATRPADLDVIRAEVAAALAAAGPQEQVIRSTEETQITLSGWQTLGAVLVVLGITLGAIGMATYGYVAMAEWGCKTGASKSGCPVVPVVKPAERSDIPA
jgi:hypothetical protein